MKQTLINLAENVASDFDFLQQSAKDSFKALRRGLGKAEVALNFKRFSSLHKAMQKQLVRLAIEELKGNLLRIDFRHWKELEDLAESRPKNSIVDLPGNISVVKKDGNLVFYIKTC